MHFCTGRPTGAAASCISCCLDGMRSDQQTVPVTQGQQRRFRKRTLIQRAPLIDAQRGLEQLRIVADEAQGLREQVLHVGQSVDILPCVNAQRDHGLTAVERICQPVLKIGTGRQDRAVSRVHRQIAGELFRRGGEQISVLRGGRDEFRVFQGVAQRFDVRRRRAAAAAEDKITAQEVCYI